MKANTVLARIPLDYIDTAFGSIEPTDREIERYEEFISEELPDDVNWCGNEIMGPVDCDFDQDDLNDILDRAWQRMVEE